MTLHIDPVEALWFIVNTATLIFSILALAEARRDLNAAALVEPKIEARLVVARGNVRREFLRVIVQTLLLSLVIPLLFDDRPVTLNPFVVALILVAVTLFTSTFFDRRDRDRLARLLIEMVTAEKATVAQESSVQEGIALTKEGLQHAKVAAVKVAEALDVANHSNAKIAETNEKLADIGHEIVELRKDLIHKQDVTESGAPQPDEAPLG